MQRRLTIAAVFLALAISGCSDNSQQGPTGPGIEMDKGVPCPGTTFPISQAKTLITQLYPAGTKKSSPLADALATAQDIAQKWSQCKVADPQGKVVTFVNKLLSDFRAGSLIGGTSTGTASLVSQLINTMYSGVGFGTPNLPVDPTTGTDFGIGFFTPGHPLLVRTNLNDAATLIPGNAFTETTAITILLRPDTPNPFDGTGKTVLPPFFEITASNLSGTHYLTSGQAVVGFCVDDATLAGLSDPAIAHLAVTQGTHPGGFEILDEASSAQYNSLGLNCAQFVPEVGALLGRGLKGFASAAPRVARAAAAAVFLPAQLEAALGKTGLGGLATSLSPFGVTDRSAPTEHISITNDPSEDHYFNGGTIDTCHDGCGPSVQILDASNNPIGEGTAVTVSLIQTEGTGGVLGGTLTQSTGSGGSVEFDDVTIDQPGTYELVFSAAGATSATSAPFHVYTLAFQTQPTATPDETRTPGDVLGETVSGFDAPVVQLAIKDFSGATVTTVSDNISMSITAGSLNGTTSVQASSGVANFTELLEESEVVQSGLTVNTDGALLTGLKLEATVFDEQPVLSASFNVDGRTF
jgi:hypothetical protein